MDPFYRYKVALPTVRHEGSGNGVQTVITNLRKLAKDLARPQVVLLKYISYELGTNVNVKEARINGHVSSDQVKSLLDRFANNYVICSVCDNPETSFVVKKKSVKLLCNACGGVTVPCQDHKIVNFVIRNKSL
jgi:translation initiation factor 5